MRDIYADYKREQYTALAEIERTKKRDSGAMAGVVLILAFICVFGVIALIMLR